MQEKVAVKQIVLSAIATMVITIGVYDVTLIRGVSADGATGPAFGAAIIVLAIAFFSASAAFLTAALAAFALFAAARATFLTAVAVGSFSAGLVALVLGFAAFFAIVCATAASADVAEKYGLKKGWVITAYLLEAVTIAGALSVGLYWVVPILLAGITALAVLWYAYRGIAKLAAS